jgi:hypothetical protein
MPNRTGDVLRTFPPRPLNPGERALVQSWLAGAYDVAAAYVSERRSDDPALYRRIVISIGPETRPTHLVHAPLGIGCWLVTAVGQDSEVQKYNSLRAALNSIRKVFTLSAAASER